MKWKDKRLCGQHRIKNNNLQVIVLLEIVNRSSLLRVKTFVSLLQSRINNCGIILRSAHLAGSNWVEDGQYVTSHHAAPVVVRVILVLATKLGGSIRHFRP